MNRNQVLKIILNYIEVLGYIGDIKLIVSRVLI